MALVSSDGGIAYEAGPFQRMFRRRPAPDLIRGGHRFAEKNMRQYQRACRMPQSTFPDQSPAELFRLLGLLWLGGVAARLPILAIPPVIPLIHDDLHLSETEVGFLSGLPLGMFALAAVPGSLLVARLGVRRTMLCGVILTAAASALRSASIDALTLFGATALTGFAVAVMQPALPSLVRSWVPARVPLGTAVYTNGMVSGATAGPAFTIPFVLPSLGGNWRLDLLLWSALIGVIALLFAAFAPRVTEAPMSAVAAPNRWWPNWKDPLIWWLGIGFGTTNTVYFGANAFLPDYLVTIGRTDLMGASLGWLNGAQLITSFSLLWLAGRVHRRLWPYMVFGPLAVAAFVAFVWLGAEWIVPAAAILGVSAAVPFVLILALPPVLSAPGDVHRTAAGMFTISYAGAVIVPVICGAVWDLTGAAWTAFVPLALCAVVMTLIGFRLTRYHAVPA
jgi:CP family cyanate transporter-like MFS transporter